MRIEPKPFNDYPWYLRLFFWNQRRKYGKVLDASLLWARSPKLFLAALFLFRTMDRKSSPLSPILRSLVMVRVSQINGCAFCVDMNSATLLKRGVSSAKVGALQEWRASDLFEEQERAVLEYAEAVTRSDIQVNDELTARLKKYLDDDAIIELTGLIACQNLSSKFNSALDIPPQGFCQINLPTS
ncbi:MAG: carboxymuconolactone decarboxylase family protein [Nitrospinae bacterium]|nr:carboxymuconolactone decarboxylase family protein [Nitrospinota bacterium]